MLFVFYYIIPKEQIQDLSVLKYCVFVLSIFLFFPKNLKLRKNICLKANDLRHIPNFILFKAAFLIVIDYYSFLPFSRTIFAYS